MDPVLLVRAFDHIIRISDLSFVQIKSPITVGVSCTRSLPYSFTHAFLANGNIDWLVCGIHSEGGWDPAYVGINDIVYIDLNNTLTDKESPFQMCKPYFDTFTKVGGEYNSTHSLLMEVRI